MRKLDSVRQLFTEGGNDIVRLRNEFPACRFDLQGFILYLTGNIYIFDRVLIRNKSFSSEEVFVNKGKKIICRVSAIRRHNAGYFIGKLSEPNGIGK